MAISRDITITVNNNTAKTNKTIYLYLGDGGLILNITVAESNFNVGDFNFTPKNIKNLALSSNSIYASVCIEKPNGDKINSIKYPIIDGMFSFEFTKDIIDEMDEVGKYQLQVHMYDSDNLNANRITIPPVALLEVLAPLCETHNHTFIEGHTEDAKVDKSITASRPLIDGDYDSEGNYNKTTWIEGQIITKEALNKMENVIFDNRRDVRKLREDTDGVLNSYQTKTDNSLMTTSKEVVGAINENNMRLKELETKNTEQDGKLNEIQTNINTINNKNTEQDGKLKEIQTNINTINNKNTEQDGKLKDIEYKNKVQDTYISGLFNENIDKRLTIEGGGNSLKLEGSKKGLVEVNKVVGNTFVNISPYYKGEFSTKADYDSYKQINTPNSKYIDDVVGTLKQDIKSNTVYSLIYNVISIGDSGSYYINNPSTETIFNNWLAINSTTPLGLNVVALTTVADVSKCSIGLRMQNYTGRGLFSFEIVGLLEGDYTDKPIPSEYFEGMQSTFEECKVTQEMVDSGEELAENLGKYKCLAKVRGKNLFDIKKCVDLHPDRLSLIENGVRYDCTNSKTLDITDAFLGDKTKQYTLRLTSNEIETSTGAKTGIQIKYTDGSYQYALTSNNTVTVTTQKGVTIEKFIMTYDKSGFIANITDIQLEEGTQVTPYESYLSRTQTVYLNSPLLKGDEIVCKEDGLYHYHKMWAMNLKEATVNDTIWNYDGNVRGEYAFWCVTLTYDKGKSYITLSQDTMCDKNSGVYQGNAINISFKDGVLSSIDDAGVKAWVEANNPIVVYELAEPYYEKISDEQIVLEIPNSATLSVESVIPCQSISATYTGNVPSVYALEETNANQDDLIDITLMATDEMYIMIEPLLAAQPQFVNGKGVSKMVDMYVAMVIRGLKTIDEVPARYREQVREILTQLEK